MELTQIGKYRIVEKLGQGAMGEVFRAHDPVLGRDIAIKVIVGSLSGDEGARARFQKEARAAAQLTHPNIITVYDFGDEQGTTFMAMELLEGADLRELIARGVIRTVEEKLLIVEQILDGLAFAHSKGVFHRDLKPGNVHVLPNGQVKIMDFGLARRAEDGKATGTIMGTPYYMAPEQAQGERATARSDVFSVGALIYELVSGKRPFTGKAIPAVLYAVVHREPEPLSSLVPDLPEWLARMVARALAKDPAQRYADAGEMLRAWAGGEVGGEALDAATSAEDRAPARVLGPPLSASGDAPAELRAVLEDVQKYLDDREPPLMVAESVGAFAHAPLEGAAAEIWDWARRQRELREELPLSDLIFHALHKLSVVAEFHLVDDEGLLGFLREVGARLAEACPPGERDRLRRALAHLGESEMVRTGAVETVRRVEEPEPDPSRVLPPNATPGLRRLALLEQRLRREVKAPGPAADAVRRRVVSQAIAAAATEARSEKELEDHLRRLREAGVASGAEQVFRSLGQELADWAMPKEVASDTADLGPPDEVKAMKQIVSLPEDPIEVARRFRHLVSAATEQFNEGNLGRAVQMFELASRLAGEKKVEPGLLDPILTRGHEALDAGMQRQYLENPDRHPQVAEVMRFFEKGLGPAPLLDQLEREDRRDRRRLLLDLLTVHGAPARALARQRLEASREAPASDFARRNWIYLLRLVPRPPDEPVEAEVEAVARFAAPANPPFLVKEALQHLGQTRHPRSAAALVALLGAWEEEAAHEDADDAVRDEAWSALDRIASALARLDAPEGWPALVEHALSRRPELGDTVSRLAELGNRDLSPSPEVVRLLVAEVRESLPRGVLGRFVSRKDQDLPTLVGALAGTRTPEVRALLEEVARRFQTQESGRAAAKALSAPAAVAPAAAPQSGELDPYTLPALLHRLAEARASGTLSLLPREKGAPATLGFAQGALQWARYGRREGTDAVYQIFERPFGGQWALDPAAAAAPGTPLPELPALIREGIRRARELSRMAAVVPDDTTLEATGEAPGTVADEADYALVVSLWEKACARVPLARIEEEIAADAFRIHRPLAQWLEEGALRVAEAPATGAAEPAGQS